MLGRTGSRPGPQGGHPWGRRSDSATGKDEMPLQLRSPRLRQKSRTKRSRHPRGTSWQWKASCGGCPQSYGPYGGSYLWVRSVGKRANTCMTLTRAQWGPLRAHAAFHRAAVWPLVQNLNGKRNSMTVNNFLKRISVEGSSNKVKPDNSDYLM